MSQTLPQAMAKATREMFARLLLSLYRALRQHDLSVAHAVALFFIDRSGDMRIVDLGALKSESQFARAALHAGQMHVAPQWRAVEHQHGLEDAIAQQQPAIPCIEGQGAG